MSLFRLSNHIFELGLDAQELSVYAYLCSFPASGFTLQALQNVNLTYLVERSMDGLYQMIDETGSGLSGGEKQRIAMARALLSKADIILLDELTSNLDSINEKIIKNVVDGLHGKKTVIMSAHRLSTTVNADTIYVLEHGRIVGKGSHQELLETVPLYRELAKEQFLA